MNEKKTIYQTQLSYNKQITEVARETGFTKKDVRVILKAYGAVIGRELSTNNYVRVLELLAVKKITLKPVKNFKLNRVDTKTVEYIDLPERPSIRCKPLKKLRNQVGLINEYDKFNGTGKKDQSDD